MYDFPFMGDVGNILSAQQLLSGWLLTAILLLGGALFLGAPGGGGHCQRLVSSSPVRPPFN